MLREAGRLWAVDSSGDSVLVEGGRLIAAWGPGDQPPLTTTAAAAASPHLVPETVALAEEAHLIWKWLDRPDVRIVESTHPLATSRHPVPRLTSLAG